MNFSNKLGICARKPARRKALFVSSKIMKTLLYILTISFLTISCKSQTDRTNSKFENLSTPKDSTALYFNLKKDQNDTLTQNALDNFVNNWFSKMLFSLNEPIIKDYKGNKEIYRFTWLRTFHHPVSIRLEKQYDEIKIITKVCNGAGGYEPGKLIQDTTFSVKQETYEKLLEKINNSNFWNLPTEKTNDNGMDGSEWIIETLKDNNYHLVIRWTPRKDDLKTFREIGEYLISISEIRKGELTDKY